MSYKTRRYPDYNEVPTQNDQCKHVCYLSLSHSVFPFVFSWNHWRALFVLSGSGVTQIMPGDYPAGGPPFLSDVSVIAAIAGTFTIVLYYKHTF